VGARYWLVALVRAVVALVAGAAITFNQGHTAGFGLIVFGAFAIVQGVVVGLGGRELTDSAARTVFLVQGAAGVAAGIVALVAASAGLGALLFVVSVWAAVSGVMELYLGLRARGREASARDWTLVGALTAVLALVFLFIPADPLLAVGLIGAYAVIIGVYLAIGAFSLRWAAHPADDAATESHA